MSMYLWLYLGGGIIWLLFIGIMYGMNFIDEVDAGIASLCVFIWPIPSFLVIGSCIGAMIKGRRS